MSDRAGHIIEYDKFYIHELDELVDIRNDYITWFQRQMFPSVSPLTSGEKNHLMTGSTCLLCVGPLVAVPALILIVCPQGPDGPVTLCRYPFVFDAQAKTTLLQTDAVLQMQVRGNGVIGVLLSEPTLTQKR